jgi:HAD superfamily hydrolase (TIGR01509 family)
MSMAAIKAIIFDFDGVIADSEIVSARVLSAALTAAGLPTTAEESRARYTGLSRADTLLAIAEFWGARVPADIAERLEVATANGFAEPVLPVPGALDFIAQVAHLPRAIASSSSSAYIRAHLDEFGVHAHFGTHVYSAREHVTRGKPYPDIYLHAAAALGVTPAETLVLEDSPVGARAAVAAGARVIGLAAASHCHPAMTAALLAEDVEAVLDSYAAVRTHLMI